MALVELLQKSGDGDFLRSVAEAVLQILMEADVEGLMIGAGRHERSPTGQAHGLKAHERLNYRNGYRDGVGAWMRVSRQDWPARPVDQATRMETGFATRIMRLRVGSAPRRS